MAKDLGKRLIEVINLPTAGIDFSADEIRTLIQDAFTASVNPSCGPISEARLGYIRNFAKIFIDRLDEQDIETGHMSYSEAVSMLLGAALTLQILHASGPVNIKE
jgi:hypothetical protein